MPGQHTPSALTLSVVGVKCIIHDDPIGAADADAPAIFSPLPGRGDATADRHDLRHHIDAATLSEFARKKQRPPQGDTDSPAPAEPAMGMPQFFATDLECLGESDAGDETPTPQEGDDAESDAIREASEAALQAHLATRPRKRRRMEIDSAIPGALQAGREALASSGGGVSDANRPSPPQPTLRLMLLLARHIAADVLSGRRCARGEPNPDATPGAAVPPEARTPGSLGSPPRGGARSDSAGAADAESPPKVLPSPAAAKEGGGGGSSAATAAPAGTPSGRRKRSREVAASPGRGAEAEGEEGKADGGGVSLLPSPPPSSSSPPGSPPSRRRRRRGGGEEEGERERERAHPDTASPNTSTSTPTAAAIESRCAELLRGAVDLASGCPFLAEDHAYHAIFLELAAGAVAAAEAAGESGGEGVEETGAAASAAAAGPQGTPPTRQSPPPTAAGSPLAALGLQGGGVAPASGTASGGTGAAAAPTAAALALIRRAARLVAAKGAAAEAALMARSSRASQLSFLAEGGEHRAVYLRALEEERGRGGGGGGVADTTAAAAAAPAQGGEVLPPPQLGAHEGGSASREVNSVSPLPAMYHDDASDSGSEGGSGAVAVGAGGAAQQQQQAPTPPPDMEERHRAVVARAARLVAEKGRACEERLKGMQRGFEFLGEAHPHHAFYITLRDWLEHQAQGGGGARGEGEAEAEAGHHKQSPTPPDAKGAAEEGKDEPRQGSPPAVEGGGAAAAADTADTACPASASGGGGGGEEEGEEGGGDVAERPCTMDDLDPDTATVMRRVVRLAGMRGREVTEEHLRKSAGRFDWIVPGHRFHHLYTQLLGEGQAGDGKAQ